jgi:brefeldin A-inhibited guanine nucleotide-exchange protein
VHDQSLLQAIRACFHIYLMSRSLINQSTAKGALTQMLNLVFQRMEHLAHQLRQIDVHHAQLTAQAKVNAPATSAVAAAAATTTTTTAGSDDTTSSSPVVTDNNGNATDAKDTNNAATATAPTPTTTPAVAGPPPSSSGGAGEGKYGLCVVCRKAANHYCVQTRDPVCGVDCKNINFNNFLNSPELQQILYQQHDDNGSGSGNRGNARVPLPPSLVASGNLRLKISVKFIQLQKDAYAVFKALCKLSSRPLPEPTEPLALRSKSLSLELILSVLENAGATFRTAPQFIKLVKDDLVMSLLKNSVTPIESIFRLSSSIFVILVAHFKLQLKKEIGSMYAIHHSSFLHVIHIVLCIDVCWCVIVYIISI